jgi:hypothetical protein
MKYTKPEVVVLEGAVRTITSPSIKRVWWVLDNPLPLPEHYHTVLAYAADE